MEINEKLLAITGKCCIGNSLQIDTEYTMATTISVYGSDTRSNNDGTQNEIFKSKITDTVTLINKGKIVLGKDKKRRSVALRGACYHLWEDLGQDFDFEAFYEMVMNKLIVQLPDIWDNIKDK